MIACAAIHTPCSVFPTKCRVGTRITSQLSKSRHRARSASVFRSRRAPSRPMHVRASARDDSGGSSKVKIVEYFVLFRVAANTEPDRVEKLLSDLWSLKYMVPNVLCASAGPTCALEGVSANGDFAKYTHAVKYRFGSPSGATEFQSHPKFLETTAAVRSEKCCEDVAEIVAQVEVPNEIQNIFKTGGTWETGVEHVMLFSDVGFDETLPVLSELATSSAGGALQSGVGSAVDLVVKGGDEEAVLVTHFPSEAAAINFSTSQAVKTLLTAAKGVRTVCFEIAPTDSKTQPKGSGGLL
ncbi:hypothetical protein BSKO_11535 [Bryopsis sp. KO-2023]|nr:hypothetical protein BSKO_11535 [Bryopsis sp. KO-2023]